MNSWQKTLLEALRDDYVKLPGKSCVYRYFGEKAAENPRVQIKTAWAEGYSKAERTKLLAQLALQTAQPADLEGIGALCGVDPADAPTKRQANARVLQGLKPVADGDAVPELDEDDLARVARALCRAGGKPGKGTTVQALSSLWDFRARDHALIVGDEVEIDATGVVELYAKVGDRLNYESKQLLLNLGVPATGRESVAAPRVSDVPTRLIEMALKEIDDLPRRLGIVAVMNTPAADQCSDADVLKLAAALGGQLGAVIPVCMDAFTGLSLCLLSEDFRPRNMRGVRGAFVAVVPQMALNQLLRGNANVPADEMTGSLRKLIVASWTPGADLKSLPVRRFKTLRDGLQGQILPLYVARNSYAPSFCPKPVVPFFDHM